MDASFVQLLFAFCWWIWCFIAQVITEQSLDNGHQLWSIKECLFTHWVSTLATSWPDAFQYDMNGTINSILTHTAYESLLPQDCRSSAGLKLKSRWKRRLVFLAIVADVQNRHSDPNETSQNEVLHLRFQHPASVILWKMWLPPADTSLKLSVFVFNENEWKPLTNIQQHEARCLESKEGEKKKKRKILLCAQRNSYATEYCKQDFFNFCFS